MRGEWTPSRPREVYGQVVSIRRLGGADSAQIENAFARRGSRKAVVVPWDYDPACAPAFWGASARWIPLDTIAFYLVLPRATSGWIGGLPVFDAWEASHAVYPLGRYYREGYLFGDPPPRQEWLPPDDYFDLYQHLPLMGTDSSHVDEALATLDGWRRSHPDAATRYPVPLIIELATVRLGRGR
jgi:hypothetical protein